jgi:subtilisin family serine protease
MQSIFAVRRAIRRVALPLVVASFALSSCGGGGGSSSPPALPAVAVTTPTPSPVPTAVATSAPTTCTAYGTTPAGATRRPAPRSGASGIVANRVYVTYASSAANARAIDAVAQSPTSIALGDDGHVAHRVVTFPASVNAASAIAQLKATPGVTSVQAVHARYAASDAVANDKYLDNVDQWYLYKTNVDPGAWALTHGSSGVSVAIIDTGVDETNQDFVFDYKESVVGGVRTTGAGSVQDTNGHGTNVAGLAVAQANNTYGFAGIGYTTHLQAYRIFPSATAQSDCQQADTADEATAIRDAVANGASVISLSLGAPQSQGADPAESAAVAYAIANNVTVVAANGNEYGTSDGNQPDYPAAYPGVIAVGASGLTDSTPNTYNAITAETVASYSNSGPTLVAPGGDASGTSDTDILHWIEGYSTTTAAYAPDQCTNTGGVCRVLFNGTSQATPQVAGTVALMMAYHGGPRSLTPAQVASLLTANADVLPGIATTRQGAGRLDAAKAVAAAHP